MNTVTFIFLFILIFLLSSTFSQFDLGTLITKWDEYITEDAPTTTNIQYTFGQPVGSDIILAGVQITFDIRLPSFPTHIPFTPLDSIGLNCIAHYFIVGDAETLHKQLLPQYYLSTPTETHMSVVFELFNQNFDVRSVSCSFHSVAPISVSIFVELTLPAATPDWYVTTIYYHSGRLLSSRLVIPPTSIEFDPNDPNQLIITMYDIQDGLYNFNTNQIVFKTPPNSIISDPIPIFTPEDLLKFPNLVNVSSSLTGVKNYPQLSYVMFSNIPTDLKQLKFAIPFNLPVATLPTIGIYSYLQEQKNAPGWAGYAADLYYTFQLDDLEKNNSNTILSIVPDIEPNRYKFNFQISPLGGSYSWIRSPLNGFFKILKCYTTPGTTRLPGQTFLPSNRLAWFLSFSASTDINSPNYGFFTCDMIASSLLSFLDRESLLESHIFENSSHQPVSNPYFSPPHSLSKRSGLLNSLMNGIAPFSTKVVPKHYLSRTNSFVYEGVSTSIIGTRHVVSLNFPGLLSNCKISITLPDYNIFLSKSLVIPKLNPWEEYSNSNVYTSRTTPIDQVDIEPTITNADNSSVDKIDNGDGTVTYLFLPSRLGTPKQDDLMDFQLLFEIFRKMSVAIDNQYLLDSNLQYVDSNDMPVPIDHLVSIQIEHFDTSSFPGDSITALGRTFDVNLGKLNIALPPNFIAAPTPNLSDKSVFPNNTSFLLLIRPDNINSPQSTPFDTIPALFKGTSISITVLTAFRDSFQFNQNADSLNLPSQFALLSKSKAQINLSVRDDLQITETIELPINVNWLTPSSIHTSPTFTVAISSPANQNSLLYEITPTFVAYTLQYTTFNIEVGSSTFGQSFNFLAPGLKHELPTIHTSQFIINSDTKLTVHVGFDSSLADSGDVPISYDLLLWYYPIIKNQVSTQPKLIHEFLRNPTDSTLSISHIINFDNIPHLPLTQHAFIELRYSFTNLTPQNSNSVSQLFTIAQACLSPLNVTILEDLANPTNWISTCGPNGICLPNGSCKCRDGYIGELCDQEVDVCASKNCSDTNTKGCSSDGQCICKDGWSGGQCRTSNQCVEQSNKQCGSHGFLIDDSITCGTKCQCLGPNWVGTACNICSLQCQNQGILYKQCDKCGCMAGFTGNRCQCRSVIGSITINAYSDAILQYITMFIDSNGQSISPPQDFLSLSRLQSYTTLYNGLLTHFINTLELDHQPEGYIDMGELASVVDNELSHTQLGIHTQPNNLENNQPNQSSTKLTATIRFGCDSYNHDDTINTIQNKWLKMAQGIAQSDVIKDNFTFWGDKVVVDDPVETGGTLPDDDDRLPINSVEMMNLGFVGMVVLFMLL